MKYSQYDLDLHGKEIKEFEKIKSKAKRYSLDIETMKIDGDLHSKECKFKMGLGFNEKILIGLYDGETYNQFNSFKEVLKFLYKQNKTSVVFAHNGGKYDFLYLMDTCIQEKCRIVDIINLGASVIFTITYKDKKIIFRDSFKILPSSLDNLCKSYLKDMRKMEMNYDLSYTIEEIGEYLKVDTISLFKVLETFENEINEVLDNLGFKRIDLKNIGTPNQIRYIPTIERIKKI